MPGVGPDMQLLLAQRVADMQHQMRRMRSTSLIATLQASSSLAADALAAAMPPLKAPNAQTPASSDVHDSAGGTVLVRTAAQAALFLTRLRARTAQAVQARFPTKQGDVRACHVAWVDDAHIVLDDC